MYSCTPHADWEISKSERTVTTWTKKGNALHQLKYYILCLGVNFVVPCGVWSPVWTPPWIPFVLWVQCLQCLHQGAVVVFQQPSSTTFIHLFRGDIVPIAVIFNLLVCQPQSNHSWIFNFAARLSKKVLWLFTSFQCPRGTAFHCVTGKSSSGKQLATTEMVSHVRCGTFGYRIIMLL